MRTMTYFDVDTATGTALPRQTRPRGQRMGTGPLWLRAARREALRDRIYTVCLWVGIVCCVVGIVGVVALCIEAGRWAR